MPARIESSRRIIVQIVYKPPLNIVWDDLGMCSPDVIGHYLQLDARYRNSREPRFMRSTSSKMNCKTLRILSCFWSKNWRVMPLGTTIYFWKPPNKTDCPESTGLDWTEDNRRAISSMKGSAQTEPEAEIRRPCRTPQRT